MCTAGTLLVMAACPPTLGEGRGAVPTGGCTHPPPARPATAPHCSRCSVHPRSAGPPATRRVEIPTVQPAAQVEAAAMLPRVWGWVVGGGDGGEGRGQPADSSGSSGRRGRHMWQKARGAAVARGSAAAAGRHLFGRAAPADVAGPCLLTCLPGPLLLQRTTPAPGVARATRWRPTANASSRRAKPRRRCSPSLSQHLSLLSHTHTPTLGHSS